jgi:hypothetical protein
VDFDALLREQDAGLPVEPREFYEQLPLKAKGYGYLRDVQAQVLTRWHEVRDQRDIVLKVNTGGGKTIDGLVILQSYLNEGIAPALYVAPDKFLVSQVVAEAGHLGLKTVTDPDDTGYLAGEAICVVTAAKVFNGASVFAAERKTPYARIGAVVIDDAHAVMNTVRHMLSMTIPSDSGTFQELFTLFEADLKSQSADAVLDIQEQTGDGLVRVPFWAVRAHVDDLRATLRKYKPAQDADKSYLAIRAVLEHCRIVFTRREVTITPPVPAVQRITGFVEAKRRVFLTATLSNDGTLVTDFDASPTDVAKPIYPLTAGDIGERMILAPEEINGDLEPDEIRKAVAKLGAEFNTLVIVPSDRAMEVWTKLGAASANAGSLQATVAAMRANPHHGIVVVANKYDGIDLPDDACRILVLDGLPQAFSPDERVENQVLRSVVGIDDRQVQRLEQGMGRAVRSNEDHCVVFLIGRLLSQLTVDPRTLERFSPATQAQLKASRTMAAKMKKTPLKTIAATARQALERDEGWVRYAKTSLRALSPAEVRIDPAAVAMRRAFNSAAAGDLPRAVRLLGTAAEADSDDRRAGRMLEQQAAYLDHYNPGGAQDVLAIARTKNDYVTRPLKGVSFRALSGVTNQAETVCARLTTMYGTAAQLLVGANGILERLTFDPMTTEDFEDAFLELGLLLGLGSQRPERELNQGPDNLWALDATTFWAVEAKTGVKTDFIAKRDVGQLAVSTLWFGKRYPASIGATPVMVHRSRKLHKEATAVANMRILNERAIGELCADTRAFCEGLAATGWADAAKVEQLLVGHKLNPAGLLGRLRPAIEGS